MSGVIVSTKGQIVLPAAVRKALGLKPGMRVEIRVEGKGARITPAPAKHTAKLAEVQATIMTVSPSQCPTEHAAPGAGCSTTITTPTPTSTALHSDALTVTERISYKGPGTLRYAMTIDDPKIFTEPWSQEFAITARPEWREVGLLEYVCEENNRCPGGVCEAP